MYLKHWKSISQVTKAEFIRILTYLQTLVELLLLLIDYTQAEVDFIGLLEVGRHSHDLGESFFCVVEGPVTVVEDTNSIPQFRLLQTRSLLAQCTDNASQIEKKH